VRTPEVFPVPVSRLPPLPDRFRRSAQRAGVHVALPESRQLPLHVTCSLCRCPQQSAGRGSATGTMRNVESIGKCLRQRRLVGLRLGVGPRKLGWMVEVPSHRAVDPLLRIAHDHSSRSRARSTAAYMTWAIAPVSARSAGSAASGTWTNSASAPAPVAI